VEIPEPEWYGAVMLRNYITPPWHDSPVSGLVGTCRAVPTEEVLGFKHNMRDSNWCVIVTGDFLMQVVPGCEVMGMVKSIRGTLPLDLNPQIVPVP